MKLQSFKKLTPNPRIGRFYNLSCKDGPNAE